MAQQNESMAEGLKKIMSAVAQLKILPDADQNLLNTIEQTIIQGIQSAAAKTQQQGQQVAQQAAGGQPQQGGQPDQGGMAGAMAGMMQGGGGDTGGGPGGPPGMPQPGGMPGGMGGGMPGLSSMPNPDELRRLMGQTTGA